jgi:endonuclease/exonuclease/phosphatase family metal-dependent hydrolase
MLEEVTTWRTGPFLQPPATEVVYDQLQLLLDALAARGLHYAPIAIQQELDFEVPSALWIDVRTTDSDVLLARTDLQRSRLAVSNVETHRFASNLTFGSPTLGELTIPRGWVSADVQIRGKTYRVVGTHLESYAPPYQVAQAGELIAALAGVTTPVILCGDFNANAEPGPEHYETVGDIVAAGFVDDWRAANPGDPGYTWPLFLEDPLRGASPDERIDLVFSRGDVDVLAAVRTGTSPGLWPSDHAGVVTTLRIGTGQD